MTFEDKNTIAAVTNVHPQPCHSLVADLGV
jgi:hypothetical protein